MTEALGFEDKVKGLADYYWALLAMDPQSQLHDDVANPDNFYSMNGMGVSQRLTEARQDVLFDIECHGLAEYCHRGLLPKDLRDDTPELRAERSDLLAVMTAPLTPEVRARRAEHISTVLGSITSGETLRVTEYDNSRERYREPKELTVDVSRALFGVFRNGQISNRDLTIQYDTPDQYAWTRGVKVGEPAVTINIPSLFKLNSLRVEPMAA